MRAYTSIPSDGVDTLAPHAADWVSGGGEMGQLIRSFNWSETLLGPIESWPQSLRSAVSILLPSKAQIAMFWGPDLVTLYNDAYRPVLGKKHPRALGQPIRDVWSELWDAGLRELFEGVLHTGEAFWASDHPFYMERFGFPEETFFDISYDPIRDESGKVGGLFCIVSDTTARVVGERRLKTLRDLSLFPAAEAKSVEDACRRVADILSGNRLDVPFALLYLLDQEGNQARLAGSSGLEAGSIAAPASVNLVGTADTNWPLSRVRQSNQAVEVTDVVSRFGELSSGAWPESPHTAMVMPIAASGQDRPTGFLVAGVSPRRPLDYQYRGFFELLRTQIATTIANARAYDEERRRAQALAELDRAKTTFFSNVSHEFRTPLTLMLGPVSDILNEADSSLPKSQRETLKIAHRNALRLQKLVNTLLDFSRIEAGRVQASFEPTDLPTLTSDLASNFRSTCERAGLEFNVDCPALGEPVYVDPDMWEKIVLNLISNAFKFTLSGKIEVTLRQTGQRVDLEVRDSGVGIPAEELPKLFERFHRVPVSQGRSQEGSGIGLALVRELVKLHGGNVSVESSPGHGSVFKVSLRRGKDHLPADRIKAERTIASTALGAAPFVSEAQRWLPDSSDAAPDGHTDALVDSGALSSNGRQRSEERKFRILLADDNADMRDYVRRLIGDQYEVRAVANGREAWDAMQRELPDLILSDVMMPVMDGFELLRAIRADSRTREAPVILLSARAGEESRIEGLEASADDYLVKPFSARELLATVEAHLKMSETRRRAQDALRASEERYRQLLSFLPVAVYMCAAPSGEITFHNQIAAQLWGREPKPGDSDERFCGSFRLWRTDGSPLPHDQTPMAIAIREGQAFRNQEVVIERPDGSRIVVLVNIDPIRDAGGKVVGAINVFHDTTALKVTQEALRTSEERYRQIFEQNIDGVFVATRDGRYVDVSPSGCEMFGMPREEILNSTFTDLVVPEEHDRLPAAVTQFGDGKVHHTEWRFRRRDGSTFIGEVSGRELPDGRLQGIVRDITERKRTEQALATHNQRLRLLWEAAGVLLTTEDPDTMLRGLFNKIRESLDLDLYFNFMMNETGDALRLLSCAGIPDETAKSIDRLELGQAVCGTAALRRQPIVATHLQSSFDPMVQLVKGFGVRAYACNPLIASGRLLGTLSFASRRRDDFNNEEIEFLQTISQYVTAAYERLHLIEALREQDRRKDEFLATLAHELRNPLAPIRNGLQLIRLGKSDAATMDRATTIMDRQLQQMVRLVDDLLDVARIQRNKLELRKEPVALDAVVQSAIETSRPLIESAGHKLVVSLPPQTVILDADPVRLAQALSNLLNNAAKYSEQGGHISLTAAQMDGDLVIKVRDSGIGIDPAKLPRIFEMFVQAEGAEDRAQGGLGIGLTLVQRLVEMHGGRVEAHSEGPGKGSEFVARLPLIVSEAHRPLSPDAHDGANSKVRRRVLVVDDNHDSAESMAMILRMAGHEVEVAHDGLAAIEMGRGFRPEIALLDLGMPKLDGYEAARRIRRESWGKDAMLIAVTGWGQEEDKRRTKAAGFNIHLVKPIDFAALETVIANNGSTF